MPLLMSAALVPALQAVLPAGWVLTWTGCPARTLSLWPACLQWPKQTFSGRTTCVRALLSDRVALCQYEASQTVLFQWEIGALRFRPTWFYTCVQKDTVLGRLVSGVIFLAARYTHSCILPDCGVEPVL